jgi:hypothetical protein
MSGIQPNLFHIFLSCILFVMNFQKWRMDKYKLENSSSFFFLSVCHGQLWHACSVRGRWSGNGSTQEEMVQLGSSGKNGRRLGAERSSSSGTWLWVDGGGGSAHLGRPIRRWRVQAGSQRFGTGDRSAYRGRVQWRWWEVLREGVARGGIRRLTAGGRRARRLAWLTEAAQRCDFGQEPIEGERHSGRWRRWARATSSTRRGAGTGRRTRRWESFGMTARTGERAKEKRSGARPGLLRKWKERGGARTARWPGRGLGRLLHAVLQRGLCGRGLEQSRGAAVRHDADRAGFVWTASNAGPGPRGKEVWVSPWGTVSFSFYSEIF